MKTIPGTKHISCFTNKSGKSYFIVQKRVNGETRNFGNGITLIEALMVRDWCQAHKWRKRYSRHSTGEKHIRKINGKYAIQKWINGELIYFGSFKSLKEAIKERNLLENYNWDLDCLCDLN